MKKRIFFVIPIIAAYLFVVLAGSAKKEIPADKTMAAFSQTWINPDYHPEVWFQKQTVNSDGHINMYRKVDSSPESPAFRSTFTIDEAWTDPDGNIWFKATDKNMNGTIFSLNRISKSGSVLESITSYGDLPDDIDPDSGKYMVYYRQ